jgi:hypothetical protein
MWVEELCKDCPKEFRMYMEHVKKLKFDEEPNYLYLKKYEGKGR